MLAEAHQIMDSSLYWMNHSTMVLLYYYSKPEGNIEEMTHLSVWRIVWLEGRANFQSPRVNSRDSYGNLI